jgi:Family of unknown function (DUF6527)
MSNAEKTTRYASIDGTYLAQGDIDNKGLPPGTFKYMEVSNMTGRPTGLEYTCPCGCGDVGVLMFLPAPKPAWAFTGELDRPTLEPIIKDANAEGTHWRGKLVDGHWSGSLIDENAQGYDDIKHKLV